MSDKCSICGGAMFRAKKLGKNPGIVISACSKLGVLVDVDQFIAEEAGILYAEMRSKKPKFRMLDAIILATVRVNNQLLLSFDADFSGVSGARVLRK